MSDAFGGDGQADWSHLGQIDFSKPRAIHTLAETGRIVTIHSADILQGTLNALYLEILATQWMGGESRENRARAKKLLSPLKWSANHALPAAVRRFYQLPGRFEHIYEQQLNALRNRNSRRGIDPGV